MSKSLEQLESLEERLRKLVAEHQELQQTVRTLREELKTRTAEIDAQKNRLKDLEESNKRIKLAERISQSDTDREELKKEIDKYLKEIDRCIALISE